ncbi:MAG: ribose-phosphate diphosphokinase [Candidatus Buchananbacteria bacterium]|jgi:ribose-phosphate pyrophosphokinase
MNRPKVLFHAPQAVALAESIIAGTEIIPGMIDWNHFQDGWPNIFIHDIDQHQECDAYFLASFSKPSDIFEQFGVLCALPRLGVGTLTIFLPFFSTGTMDRAQQLGEVITARTMARMFDTIPDARFGKKRLVIHDIHALQEYNYFHEILPRLESAIPLLHDQIKKLAADGEEIAIAFPDDGAHKRFGSMFDDWPQIICLKVRQGDGRIVTIKEGDSRGKHAIIVDDLVLSGGTIIECAKALRNAGSAKVSAFTTHGVFPNESWRKFSSDLFTNYWLTDSCPQIANLIDGVGPFKVLSLAPLIQDMIRSDNKYT